MHFRVYFFKYNDESVIQVSDDKSVMVYRLEDLIPTVSDFQKYGYNVFIFPVDPEEY